MAAQICFFVDPVGLEPTTTGLQSQLASKRIMRAQMFAA